MGNTGRDKQFLGENTKAQFAKWLNHLLAYKTLVAMLAVAVIIFVIPHMLHTGYPFRYYRVETNQIIFLYAGKTDWWFRGILHYYTSGVFAAAMRAWLITTACLVTMRYILEPILPIGGKANVNTQTIHRNIVYKTLNKLSYGVCLWSVRQAVREQGLLPLYRSLERIVPDITHHYNSYTMKGKYHLTKTRAQQSFQISLALETLSMFDVDSVMDIGDSAGNHLKYMQSLTHSMRVASMNTDQRAIDKIEAKGITAIRANAIEYDWDGTDYDMFTAFEVLEHLSDPIKFLVRLKRANSKVFVITVPYLRETRIHSDLVGDNEEFHIHELCPSDWKFLFALTGWYVIAERTYFQFPRRVPGWGELAAFWERNDFWGFWGAILKCGS